MLEPLERRKLVMQQESQHRFVPKGVQSRTGRNFSRVIAVAAILLSLDHSAWAQKDTASIVGTVRDPSGAVVPGAQVTATDVNRGTAFATSTDGSGDYVAGPLKIGRYTVKVNKKDFETSVIGPFDLQVGQRREVNVKMKIGAAVQNVQVSAVPSLETQTSDLGQVIDNHAINNLPLNGRNFSQLALLSAGIAPAEHGASNGSTSGFSANGARSYQNNYLLDGVDNNSNITDLQTGASYVIQPSVDAVEEFNVETNGDSAEFGRGNGAVLNATIKSGTNEFHGSVFEFLRNDKLDAKNYFERKRGAYLRNQFGATLGGPVLIPHLYNGRNHSFFFVDYEGLRIRQERPLQDIVPTPAMRLGDFSTLIDYTSDAGVTDCNGGPTYLGEIFNTRLTRKDNTSPTGFCGLPFGYDSSGNPLNIIPPSLLDPLAVSLTKLWPLPTISGNGGIRAINYLTEPKVQESQNNFDVRLDQTFSEKDSGFTRYSYQVQPSTHPAVFQATGGGGNEASAGYDHNFYSSVALSETHIFNPHLGNEARFGYNRVDARHLDRQSR